MIRISSPDLISDFSPQLPASKSISNRLLMLNALSERPAIIHQLSEAEDTRVFQKLLAENSLVEDCVDGGTTSRFLIALRCVQQHCSYITGSAALQQRPFAQLLEALEKLGAEFEFPDQPYQLPLKIIRGIYQGGKVEIAAGVSSQFISALMMIAPKLNGGLVIVLNGEVVSAPYLHTTAKLMQHFGVQVTIEGNTILIPEAKYSAINYTVGKDWSAAGYWYALIAALPGSSILLKGLHPEQLQADEIVAQRMLAFGVSTSAKESGLRIRSEAPEKNIPLQFDFTSCPDLAQTFAVLASLKNVPLKLTGIKTLKIKETDRIHALATELRRAGAEVEADDYSLNIISGIRVENLRKNVFRTYNDHRMAMSLSILACSGEEITLDDETVVSKSYPTYWDELRVAGFTIRG